MTTLAILFAAAQTVAAPPPRSSHECVAVEVLAPREARTKRTKGEPRVPRVSAARTVDLQLQVRMRPVLTGDHLLHLKLYTPRGYLYQTMTLPFRFEPKRAAKKAQTLPATRRVEGFPRPLPVQSLTGPTRRRPQGNRVTARLPVAGTSIALGSLFGGWTAVPYLDDRVAPCGPAASFVIDE